MTVAIGGAVIVGLDNCSDREGKRVLVFRWLLGKAKWTCQGTAVYSLSVQSAREVARHDGVQSSSSSAGGFGVKFRGPLP